MSEMSKMVQAFMVLRCFSCETFQVHQVKKSSNKWLCKICNEKQSVKKVYGQGSAGNCRKQVQKLNMLRGENEAAEQQLLNHPPEDYAATFDKERHHGDDTAPEHPVLLTGKGSRWKLFTEPQDSTSEEEAEDTSASGPYTTNRREFEEAKKRKRRVLKRHVSDPSKLHPLSKAARGASLTYKPPSSASYSHTPVHPYSSVSNKMGLQLSGLKSSESCYLYSSNDRYQKLNDDRGLSNISSSQSVQNLSSYETSNNSEHSPTQKPRHQVMSQQDRLSSIRNDISRFTKTGASDREETQAIPTASSRWSKFMNEQESEDELGEEGEGRQGEGGGEREVGRGRWGEREVGREGGRRGKR